jgi:SWIM zinc finger
MTDPTVAQPRCPDSLTQAIKQRATRGLLLYNRERHRIHQVNSDAWAVPSSQGGYWIVNLDAESCECPDFTHYGSKLGVACKHVAAAALARAKRRPVQDHPHACIEGWVYLGYTDDDEAERVEALPCRRCANEAGL